MREALDAWTFVIVAYVVSAGVTAALVAWSHLAMLRAEARREQSRQQ